ncbi:uncharacterized protein [Mytilus edulis]
MPFTICPFDHKVIAAGSLSITTGIAVFTTYKWLSERRRKAQSNVYESEKLVNEYLAFHFANEKNIRLDLIPSSALDFPKRCADLCLKHSETLLKFNSVSRALDIGCAVGRSSFELARKFQEVIGIDYSQAFVDACQQLKDQDSRVYFITDEGELTTGCSAKVAEGIDKSRCSFQQGDACDLPHDIGKFGCVLAANLICRLHTPVDFLNRMADLVIPGGILVITSPYTFLEEFTPKSNWLGGYIGKDNKPVTGKMTLKKVLGPAFDLVDEVDMPFSIRETARKNQLTVAEATVWRRKNV